MQSLPVTLSDHELLERLREGDEFAASQIYSRYAVRLRAVIRRRCSQKLAARVEPDDLLQSAFGSFFRRVTPKSSQEIHLDRIWGLLLVISLNKIRDAAKYHFAEKRDPQRISGSALLEYGIPDRLAPDELVLRELTDQTNHLVGQLPEPDRTILRFRMQGLEISEIAKRCCRSRRTVERVLQHFRTRLEAIIRKE